MTSFEMLINYLLEDRRDLFNDFLLECRGESPPDACGLDQ